MADSTFNIESQLEKKALPSDKGEFNLAEDVLINKEELEPTEEESPADPDDPYLKFLAFITVIIAGFFALLDGLYLSMSALRLSCGLDTESFNKLSGNNNKFNGLTNHWGNHKGLLIGFLLLIPTMILLAILGDKALNINEQTQTLWLYLRAAFSSLKNTRTSAISMAFIAQAFANSTRFYAWANPIGFAVGLLIFVPNILWLQRERRIRDELMEKNKAAEEKLNAAKDLEELGERPIAARHTPLKQAVLYASVFADGLSDGIYIYASLFLVLGLSTMVFPPALLIAATVTMAVITLVSIVSKLNAERKQSAALELSAVNVDIAYLEKKKMLNGGVLGEEENEELISLKEKQEKLNETVNSDNKSFLFLTGRQTIMGFKNAAAAGAVLLMIPGLNIVGLATIIVAKVLGFAYACYLAIPEIKKYIQSRETKKDAAEEKSPSIKDSLRHSFFAFKKEVSENVLTPATNFLKEKISLPNLQNVGPIPLMPGSLIMNPHAPSL